MRRMIFHKSICFNKCAYASGVTLLALVVWFAGCGSNSELPTASHESVQISSPDAVNINTASAAELEKIPHIGEKLAREIIDHRERFGPFRRAEHLILIQGISDARFRKMRGLIRVD